MQKLIFSVIQLADARANCYPQQSQDCPQDVKELIDGYDWHILPVLNPDGYQYTRQRVLTFKDLTSIIIIYSIILI